jgi:ketosteroid isomerase-like protein
MHTTIRIVLLTTLIPCLVTSAAAQLPSACGTSDSVAAVRIRQRLQQWVEESNRGDRAAANTIWAPHVVGWFPTGAEFGDSAAHAAAGIPADTGRGITRYQVRVDDVAVSNGLAAVHDIWQEWRHFPGARVGAKRELRGSELWRCQSDGSWKIVRWVSAPEHWVRSE